MKLLIFVAALFLYMVSCADLNWDAKFSASISFEIGSAVLQFNIHWNR